MIVWNQLQMTDAMLAGATGGAAAAVALLARWADLRRLRRRNPDAVGFMPWTAIYFIALFVACIALGIAARDWPRV